MPDPTHVLLLCVAAGFAGWIDAVSGGGGLVQLPALLIGLPHAAPAVILATNKLSSVCGTAASALTYQRRGGAPPPAPPPAAVAARPAAPPADGGGRPRRRGGWCPVRVGNPQRRVPAAGSRAARRG